MTLREAILWWRGEYDEKNERGKFYVLASCLINEIRVGGSEQSYFLELRRYSDDYAQAVIRRDSIHPNSGQSRTGYQSAPSLLDLCSIEDVIHELCGLQWNERNELENGDFVFSPKYLKLVMKMIGPTWPIESR